MCSVFTIKVMFTFTISGITLFYGFGFVENHFCDIINTVVAVVDVVLICNVCAKLFVVFTNIVHE